MTRGWKKGVGNWVSTSVFVRLEDSLAVGELTNVGEEFISSVGPDIEKVLDEVDTVMGTWICATVDGQRDQPSVPYLSVSPTG
jgi:hypothetical protein